ncbi:unnamed protein product [Closterium sp. Yama58-4]|nr:unnamed protein product [Closterium sp. Yama58-4]
MACRIFLPSPQIPPSSSPPTEPHLTPHPLRPLSLSPLPPPLHFLPSSLPSPPLSPIPHARAYLSRLPQEDKAVLTYVCPDPAHLWTLAGLELMEILERMGERVAAMGLKCGERRLHQLANVFGEMRHPETVFSHFRLDAQEQETLFCFMQEEVEKLGEVRSSMERLNTLRSLLSDALADGEGKEDAEKEGDSSSWMPRCDLPGAEEILKLLLVLAIILLRDRIISVFAINARSSDALTREGSLGRAGLALRYAKVINLAEKLMKYPFMAAGSTRDELYGLLTYSTKKDLALRLSRPTLYHAQKAVIDASLLDALEGVSRLVASDASNLTQLNSRKMEAMAAEARKKLDKASADSKKPRAVMISGIFKPKRAAAGIVQGAPLPMVFEPATEVGKVTEKGKAPELSPRAAVPLSPTGASAAEPAASFLVKSGSVSAPRSVSPASAAAASSVSARTRFPTSASVSVAGSSAAPFRSSDLTQKVPRPLPALPAAPDASTPGQTGPLPSPSLLAQSLLSTSSLPSSQISSLVESTPSLSPPLSATPHTPPPPDTPNSPKSPLKPRPPSQPPVRPPFRGSAANSVDLTGGGDNPRSPRGFVRAAAEESGGSAGAGGGAGAGYADRPPRSPRAYVRFADAPAGLGAQHHLVAFLDSALAPPPPATPQTAAMPTAL